MTSSLTQRIAGRVRAVAVWLGDALNPIAVKELRQAVNARYVSGLLLVFLFGQLITLAVIVLDRGEWDETELLGRRAFTILYGILIGGSMLAGPVYIAMRRTVELYASDTDLTGITPIRPATVVWGRVSSALALVGLIFGATAPFLIFTYMLRGVDLSIILLLLVGGFIGTAVVTQIVVFLVSVRLPAPKLFTPFVQLVSIGAAFLGAFGMISVAIEYVSWGIARYDLTTGQFVAIVSAIVVLGLLAFGFFFVLSLAVSLHRTANRALPVRAYMTAMWPISLGAMAAWSLILEQPGPVHTWMIVWCLLLIVGLAVAVSERDVLAPRIVRTIPRGRWRRRFAFLLYSGSAGGVVWCSLMLGVTLAFGALWGKDPWTAVRFGSVHRGGYYDLPPSPISSIVGCVLFFHAYMMTGALVRRWWFSTVRHQFTWVFGLGVGAAAFVVGAFAYAFILTEYKRSIEFVTAQYMTPLILSAWHGEVRDIGYTCAVVWAAVVSVGAVPWLADRMRSFRRLDLARRVDLGHVVYE
ncbi:MAG: hypothetical protein JW889_10655 [Verrucomicrobia bacterium]|nr:hypothetical protein [Verrucomicrobiota bacterium]